MCREADVRCILFLSRPKETCAHTRFKHDTTVFPHFFNFVLVALPLVY